MKSFVTNIGLVWSLFILPLSATAQTCSTSDAVSLSSQQEVNLFQENYGPCDFMEHRLDISGEDIVDLGPLEDIVQINNFLNIIDNPNLHSLEGLERLSLLHSLYIDENPQIVDLSGLTGLRQIFNSIVIEDNLNLRSIRELESLDTINWLIRIKNNPLLESLEGLSATIQRESAYLVIEGNDALVDLRGLPQFQHLSTLQIKDNANLISLNGLEVIGGGLSSSVFIQQNPHLVNLQNMEWLKRASKLRIIGNDELASISSLSNLTQAELLNISNNDSLESLSGLENLVEISDIPHNGFNPGEVGHGYLFVRNNFNLQNLDGLQSLEAATDINIWGNFSLSDCSGLTRLLDPIDHGTAGPGPPPDPGPVLGANPRIVHIPDISRDFSIGANRDGCRTSSDIFPLVKVERVLTGSWFSPHSAGEGFMIHAVREHKVEPFLLSIGLAIGYFYGYDNEGERFWLIGVHEGEMQWNEPIEFTATKVVGGSFGGFDPIQIDEVTWGTFSFTPQHCEAGVISLSGRFDNQGPVQEKSLDVVRLGGVSGDYCSQEQYEDFSDSLTSSWFETATVGQGFAFHKMDNESGIVYYYGFDAEGIPLWLVGVWSGQVQLGETLEVPMLQVSGGTFEDVDPGDITEELWGTLLLNMDDCPTGVVELIGIDGTQMLSIEQLAPSLGLECQ